VPSYRGSGLFNQLIIFSKSIYLATKFNRKLYFQGFLLDYRHDLYTDIGNIFDLEVTNNELMKLNMSIIHEGVQNMLSTTSCLNGYISHLDFVVQPCLPAKERFVIRDYDDMIYNPHSYVHNVTYLSIHPHILITANVNEYYVIQIMSKFQFRSEFHNIATRLRMKYKLTQPYGRIHNMVSRKVHKRLPKGIAVNNNYTTTSAEVIPSSMLHNNRYFSIHLRLEDDFLGHITRERYLYDNDLRELFPKFKINHDEANLRIIDDFLDFLEGTYKITSDSLIHLCASTNDGDIILANAIKKMRYLYPNMVIMPKQNYIFHKFDFYKIAFGENNQSESLLEGPVMREVHAIIDFLVATESYLFIGIQSSTFSKYIRHIRIYRDVEKNQNLKSRNFNSLANYNRTTAENCCRANICIRAVSCK
jgi:hypothetical protein